MLSLFRPKHVMIFGIIAMLCGLGVYALWTHTRMPGVIRHWELMKFIRRDMGRYWVSGIYFVAGLLVFLRGYFGMRLEERSRNPVNRM
jgi:hypothetical protein